MSKKKLSHTESSKIPQIILLTGKFLSFISPGLLISYATKLFTSPTKYKVPERESEMDQKSIQNTIKIVAINKEIVVYEYGKSDKKVLLVHGWSGRGTQLFKIAGELLKHGYETISFDAPAHGKSPGKTTHLVDFIASVLEIGKRYGPFEVAVGHSFGSTAILNAVKQGLNIRRAVIIGSGDIIEDIIDDFVFKLELKPDFSVRIRDYFENKYNIKMNNFSSYIAAAAVNIPVLVIHDKNDPEVPVKAGIHINDHLKNGTLLLTEGLGHRKILGDADVISKIIQFIEQQ